jgi:uncharacterized protein
VTSGCLAVLARAPVPGLAKTRLIPYLGTTAAAEFQGLCLQHTLQVGAQAEFAVRGLWCDPDVASFEVFRSAGQAFELHTQASGDLGQRMLRVFRAHCPCGPTVLIGTDCLVMTPDILRTAAELLSAHYDAVVIPAEDGGYVLLGLREPVPELFTAMSWGTAQVMDETRARMTRCGLRWIELPTLWDVDRPEDFERLLATAPTLLGAALRTLAPAAETSCADPNRRLSR